MIVIVSGIEVRCSLMEDMCFFFQAEDGIRDLVRSRGLGDVYKRQAMESAHLACDLTCKISGNFNLIMVGYLMLLCPSTVSYTHLTLPTSDLV